MRFALFSCISLVFFIYFSIYGSHIRLLMFLSGILVFEFTENKKMYKMPPIGLAALCIAIILVILLNVFEAHNFWRYVLLYVLFFVFCTDCFLSDGLTKKLFEFKPIRWLGNMSYSYYLIHGLTLKFIFLMLSIICPPANADDWLFWVALPLTFAVTLISSTFLFIYIEKPFSLTIPQKSTKSI